MIDLSPLMPMLAGKSLAIFGLARSGLAAAAACKAAGIDTVLWDDDAVRRESAALAGYTLTDLTTADLSPVAALMLSPGVPLTHPAPHAVVVNAQKYGIEIVSDIELMMRAHPDYRTVGVTGTNGKSTTTALVAHCLNASGVQALACGNIGDPVLGLSGVDSKTVLIIEMSSYQIDLCPRFRPLISVFLNITPDHLDRHGTMENYVSIKTRLLEGAGHGFIGVDDVHTQEVFARTKNPPKNAQRSIAPFSAVRDAGAGLLIHDQRLVDQGQAVLDLRALPTLKGLHNAQNVMAAYLVCRTLGVSPDKIASAMQTYPGLPHRQFLVRTIGQVAYINDSKATNADATEKALATFENIYWIVGGKPKAGGLAGLEKYIPNIRKAYLIGAASEEFASWMEMNSCPYERAGTLDVAMTRAHQHAQAANRPGVVLLSPACASFDQFQSYEHRGEMFVTQVCAL